MYIFPDQKPNDQRCPSDTLQRPLTTNTLGCVLQGLKANAATVKRQAIVLPGDRFARRSFCQAIVLPGDRFARRSFCQAIVCQAIVFPKIYSRMMEAMMVFSSIQKTPDTSRSESLPADHRDRATPAIDHLDTVKTLQQRIHSFEVAQRVDPGTTISSGCAAINRLLPSGGYAKGILVQWLSNGGYGTDYLSLLTAREACQAGGALVVIDPDCQFYPPAAAAIGINMGNLIVLRNRSPASSYHRERSSETDEANDLLWSIDQALRCPAVGAVWGPLPTIDERWFRRFQLSAESSGCLGLFLQSIQEARQPSWAEVQWLVHHARPATSRPELTGNRLKREPAAARRQQLQLQLTRCRGTQTGKKLQLEIDTVTGLVSS